MFQFQRERWKEEMATMLRVHSQDLHEHVASEAGECLDSGLYTDLAIRWGSEFIPCLSLYNQD